MSKFGWLHNVEFFAPLLLPLIPGFPPALTPHIVKGIQAAEAIEGASSKEKLDAAIEIAKASAEGIESVKPGLLNSDAVVQAATSGIATVIAVSNIASKAAAAPPVAPAPQV